MNQPLENIPMQAGSDVGEAPPILTLMQVESARQIAAQSNRHILDTLEEVSGLDSNTFILALGELMRYQVFGIFPLYVMTPDFALLPFAEAGKQECLMLRDTAAKLHIIFANPFDVHLQGRLELLIDEPATWGLAHRKDIAAFLSRYEESMRAMDGLLPEHAETESGISSVEDISLRSISEDTSPIVRLVRSTLYDALKAGASDIHMETDPHGLTIKYRIDGVLSLVGSANGITQAEQAISRIKVMSELDIAERRIPQDGRFKVMAMGREVDLRVSIMPSVFGEDAVLRILDRKTITDQAKGLSMEVLGFEESIMSRFRLLAEEPYGMLLVTGPTGSGKTT
ncbi:MAG: ATPase, T2SS/T4P/T4SS family, partial [Nitrosomonadales bacterium]|nr:ATPase, T2SS/T4P/T4SS family [Nitrosomonadales bacterium]